MNTKETEKKYSQCFVFIQTQGNMKFQSVLLNGVYKNLTLVLIMLKLNALIMIS